MCVCVCVCGGGVRVCMCVRACKLLRPGFVRVMLHSTHSLTEIEVLEGSDCVGSMALVACVCMHLHSHTHTYTHTNILTYTHTHTHTHTRMAVHTYICIYTHLYIAFAHTGAGGSDCVGGTAWLADARRLCGQRGDGGVDASPGQTNAPGLPAMALLSIT